MSLEIGDVQLLDIMNFLGGATSLKAFKTSETKGFFPFEWFDCPQKMNNSEFPPYDAFFSKLRNVDPWKRTNQVNKKYLAADSRLKKRYLK